MKFPLLQNRVAYYAVRSLAESFGLRAEGKNTLDIIKFVIAELQKVLEDCDRTKPDDPDWRDKEYTDKREEHVLYAKIMTKEELKKLYP